MFAGLSTKPDFFAERLNLFIALAPVARIDKCHSAEVQKSVKDPKLINLVIEKLGFELMPDANASSELKGAVVALFSIGLATFKLVTDDDLSLISEKAKDNTMGHYPAGCSIRQVLHFRSTIKSQVFEEYNFGPEENMRRYGYAETR